MARKKRSSDGRGRAGRPPKLAPGDVEVLTALVRENPLLSLDDIVSALRRGHGITVSAATARKYLKEAGFQRSRPRPGPSRPEEPGRGEEAGSASTKVYGYGEAHRDPGDETRYPCGLTDSEWERVAHIFDPPGKTGRPPKYPRRQMLDACVYVLRSGCSWRTLAEDFPPWQAVYRTFRRWLARGLFEEMYDELRKLWRSRERRGPDPTAAVLDSQSVKTSAQGGPKGYDAAKKIKGRKRHRVTDTLGLLLAVLVTVASTQDRDAARPAEAGIVRHPGNRNVGQWHQDQLSLFDVPRGFVVLPKRWIMERTNAWNDRPRRMTKDHDRNPDVSTGSISLAEGRRLLRRLTWEGPEPQA